MTTTTTFQGIDPSAKNSSRVLRPPGGVSNISFGTDEEKPPVRKNRMASNIFAGPDDPHAHRRNNPPGGEASGVLCGEPSAPLRRCYVPPPWKNSELEEAPRTLDEKKEHTEDAENAEEEEEEEEMNLEQEDQPPQPSPPTEPAPGAGSAARKHPPGGKSSLILG